MELSNCTTHNIYYKTEYCPMCTVVNDNNTENKLNKSIMVWKKNEYMEPKIYLYYNMRFGYYGTNYRFNHNNIYFSDKVFKPDNDYSRVNYNLKPIRKSYIEFIKKGKESIIISIQEFYFNGGASGYKMLNHSIGIDEIIMTECELIIVPCFMNTDFFDEPAKHGTSGANYIGFTIMLLNDFKELNFVKKLDCEKIIKYTKGLYYIDDSNYNLIKYVIDKMTKTLTLKNFSNNIQCP